MTKKNGPNPFVHITTEAKNTTFIDCEFQDHGTGRPFLKDEGLNTKLIGIKFIAFVGTAKKHPILTTMCTGLFVVIVGLIIEYSFFV
jgi:hypothetical protein